MSGPRGAAPARAMFDRRRLLGLAAVCAVSACATGPRVHSDFDPGADFAAFHTYTWAATNVQPGVSPLTWQRVKDAVDRTLQARGFTEGEPADFAVGFTLGKRDRIETWNYGPYYSGWNRWGGMAWTAPQTQIRQITEGTLAIDVFDARTQRPVWQGTATQTLNGPVSQADVDAAVTAVLAKFPPGREQK